MILLVLMLACSPKTPPAVFSEPLEELVEPAPTKDPVVDSRDLDDIYSLKPGQRAVGVDESGNGTTFAVMLPPSEYAFLLRDGIHADHWQGEARRMFSGRNTDRLICEQVAGDRWEYGKTLAAELRWRRVVTAVALGGVFAVGVTVGVAIESAVP